MIVENAAIKMKTYNGDIPPNTLLSYCVIITELNNIPYCGMLVLYGYMKYGKVTPNVIIIIPESNIGMLSMFFILLILFLNNDR